MIGERVEAVNTAVRERAEVYAKSGDIHIAYQVTGDGPPDVVWTPGAISHLDLWWESPYFVRQFERVSSFCRLILFDKRGRGLSDRPTASATRRVGTSYNGTTRSRAVRCPALRDRGRHGRRRPARDL
jgi:pimeloyl-ACP methyl ester carboxylesterase